MPPPPTQTVPSQLLVTAVMAFRTLVETIQGTENQANQLGQMVNSMGDIATMFERIATTTAEIEQQFQPPSGKRSGSSGAAQPAAAASKPASDT